MRPREVLNVRPNASSDEVKSAFRQAAKEIHPDHSDDPAAAEAFIRLRQAYSELLKEAEVLRTEHAVSVVEEVKNARSAASQAAQATPTVSTVPDDDFLDGDMTIEEIEHIQNLDQMAARYASRPGFLRFGESKEVREHRRRLNTNLRRLSGRY